MNKKGKAGRPTRPSDSGESICNDAFRILRAVRKEFPDKKKKTSTIHEVEIPETEQSRIVRKEKDLFSLAMLGVRPLQTETDEKPQPAEVNSTDLPKTEGFKVAKDWCRLGLRLPEVNALILNGRPVLYNQTPGEVLAHVPFFDTKLLNHMRSTKVQVDGKLDLHGCTFHEAQEALEQFVIWNYRKHRKCLLIIHGKGMNSKKKKLTLAQLVPSWLTETYIGCLVQAVVTAHEYLGGQGAVVVFLREPIDYC